MGQADMDATLEAEVRQGLRCGQCMRTTVTIGIYGHHRWCPLYSEPQPFGGPEGCRSAKVGPDQ